MAQQTEPLGLYKWTEADPFRVSEVNANFEALAGHIDLKSSERQNAQNGSASWRVRKFYDGTVELYCRLTISLPCSVATGAMYCSAPGSVLFPANAITSIDCVQLTVGAGSNIIWAVNQTANSDNSGITFRCASPINKASAAYIDILVKGVASNV